jgi:hypothetical protein
VQIVYEANLSNSKKIVLNSFCVGFPIILAIFGYALDTNDREVPNAVLNLARHGFSCSMRFASMPLEWVGIWARTLPPCISRFFYTLKGLKLSIDFIVWSNLSSSLSFLSLRFLLEWYFGLYLFFGFVVENPLITNENS